MRQQNGCSILKELLSALCPWLPNLKARWAALQKQGNDGWGQPSIPPNPQKSNAYLKQATGQTDKKVLDKLHKSGKLLVRERIEKLVDPGSPFLEFSPLAGH